jgi:putative hydrolase of the HAD superfamily
MSAIKNILFDLGNVLLDLKIDRTEEAFRELLQEDFEKAYLTYEGEQLFERFEVGQISPFEFVRGMRAAAQVPLTDDDVIDSWNALLEGIPTPRMEWLQGLSSGYDLYLLSNTNALHMMWLDEYLHDAHGSSLDTFKSIFQHCFLSYQIRMRKPESEVFQYVLEQAGIKPEETLFVDDRLDNIQAARGLGYQTYQHRPDLEIARELEKILS